MDIVAIMVTVMAMVMVITARDNLLLQKANRDAIGGKAITT